MPERLQKIIAESGLMSRRAAEEAILAGRVEHSGRKAIPGDKAELGEEILLDGKPIPGREEKHYYLLNKPRGYVCTMHDEKGRRTVRELLPRNAGRVYPVGRLDMMSEGLLLMTNDGDFAYRLSHPSNGWEKTYDVHVKGKHLHRSIERFNQPFDLDGVEVCPVAVRVLKCYQEEAVLEITICEGRNRELRRMCEEARLQVLRLIRIREGPFQLDGLPCGKARSLRDDEIEQILTGNS